MKIFALTLFIFLLFCLECSPALSQVYDELEELAIIQENIDTVSPRVECIADYINIPKKTLITVGIDSMKSSVASGSISLNKRCATTAQNMEVGGSGLTNIGNQNDSNILISTRVLSNSPVSAYIGFIKVTSERPLSSSELNRYSCLFPGINVGLVTNSLNFITSILPASPDAVRIPTLITSLFGENSLASNLAIELYSGAWQYLSVLIVFKMVKLAIK